MKPIFARQPPLFQIDEVLRVLREEPPRPELNITEIIGRLSSTYEGMFSLPTDMEIIIPEGSSYVPRPEMILIITEILDKLIEDGHAIITYRGAEDWHRDIDSRLQVTFKGRIFIGYAREWEMETTQNELLKYQVIITKQQADLNPKLEAANEASGKIQSRLLSINQMLLLANLGIFLGGFVAAGYYFAQTAWGSQYQNPCYAILVLSIALGLCLLVFLNHTPRNPQDNAESK